MPKSRHFIATETPPDYMAGCPSPFCAEAQAVVDRAMEILKARLASLPYGDGQQAGSPDSMRQLLALRLADLADERLVVAYLDTRHRLIAFETAFVGTVNQGSVYPRTLVRRVLELNASAVVMAHNHPSRVPEASQADLAITTRVRQALDLVGARLLDHFIVGGDAPAVSLAERGLV